MIASNRVQRAKAHGLVLFCIMKKLQKPFLPKQSAFVPLEQVHGFFLKHLPQQIVYILKMIIEVLPPYAASLRKVVYGDLINGFCAISSFNAAARVRLVCSDAAVFRFSMGNYLLIQRCR